jgi:hypothetical protein
MSGDHVELMNRLTLLLVAALLVGCLRAPDLDAGNLETLATDDEILASFKKLHERIYRVYSLGPDRDAIHDLLSASFAGRALTEEYVEHFTTIIRMQEEQTAIAVARVDYEDVRVLERTPRSVRLDVDWSVGGVVTHQNHQHARINRYQAVYTVANRSEGLRIVATRVRNSERVGTLMSSSPTWPLDQLPESGAGYMDPLELLRAGSEAQKSSTRQEAAETEEADAP